MGGYLPAGQIWYNCRAGESYQLSEDRTMHLMWSILICLSTVVFFGMDGTEAESAGEKITIGGEEEVMLLPWGVVLPARIDTGASTTSLDARHLTVKKNMAEFELPEKYGGLKVRLPVVGWRTVRSAEHRERRPIVEIDLCLGQKQMRTRVNLNDRSSVAYPMIIGRNILRNDFVVDCARSNIVRPSCSEPAAK
jgi:hypothetical protein